MYTQQILYIGICECYTKKNSYLQSVDREEVGEKPTLYSATVSIQDM